MTKYLSIAIVAVIVVTSSASGDARSVSSESPVEKLPDSSENFEPAKIPYSFNYRVIDEQGTETERTEESDGSGSVRGSYGYADPESGLMRRVNYVADHLGYRASIVSNEPGMRSQDGAALFIDAQPVPYQQESSSSSSRSSSSAPSTASASLSARSASTNSRVQ